MCAGFDPAIISTGGVLGAAGGVELAAGAEEVALPLCDDAGAGDWPTLAAAGCEAAVAPARA
jgi:hypothetical protein